MGITCCTPVLLMSSGDVWSLKPCHCTTDEDQGLKGNCDSGKLLRGFGKTMYTVVGYGDRDT